MSKYSAEISDEYIAIYSEDGDEVAYGDSSDWADDETMTVYIARAIKLAYSQPDELEKLLGREVATL